MENKKRVATVFHANGVERFVCDEIASPQYEHEGLILKLNDELVAIIYKAIYIKFEDYEPNKRVPFSQSDFDKAFSGTPNEHNMNPEDAEWYKNHMKNQSDALRSGEKVCFWPYPDGSVGSDTELMVGDELVGLTEGGDTDYIRVIGVRIIVECQPFVKGTYCYLFGRSINTTLSWYITNRGAKTA